MLVLSCGGSNYYVGWLMECNFSKDFKRTTSVAFNFTISFLYFRIFEPPHDKTNKVVCAPSEDSDQPGHPPSLIRVFAVRSIRCALRTVGLI